MKKQNLPLILVICSILLSIATVALAQNTKTLPLPGITEVEIGSGLEVYIEKGPASLTLTGGDSDFADFEMTIEGNTLNIEGKIQASLPKAASRSIVISLPELHSLSNYTAASIYVSGFDNETLFLTLEGVSKCELDIKVSTVKIDVAGTSSIYLQGEAQTVVANLSGAAALNAADYAVQHFTLLLSGAAFAKVDAREQLDINISGVGAVQYRGEPTVLRKRISGAGKITQFD